MAGLRVLTRSDIRSRVPRRGTPSAFDGPKRRLLRGLSQGEVGAATPDDLRAVGPFSELCFRQRAAGTVPPIVRPARGLSLVVAVILGLVGSALLAGAWNSDAGPGPVELFVGLIPIGLAALLVRATDVPAGSKKACPDCRATVPDEARVCRHCGYEFWQREAEQSRGAAKP